MCRFSPQFKVQEDKDRNVCGTVSLLYFLVFYTLTAIGYYLVQFPRHIWT